ncbi:MAG: glycosyltransferase, partial [Planctomycetota bacterium]
GANVDTSVLAKQPNVHLLGRQPYEDLPAYCRAFDVGLIPFAVNDLTRAVNPIKLREYWAAGLPVATTPLPEVTRFGGAVHVGDTVESFEAAVESALAELPDVRRQRSDAMAAETWRVKLQTVSDALSGVACETS